jgi:uncharacterized protein DUF4314
MIYYVATLARYVLVEAENEWEARERGYAALYQQYEDVRRRFGCGMPVEIRTIRPATEDEIEHMRWHEEYVAAGKRPRVAARRREPPSVDPAAQAKTDWTPVRVPGHEKAYGPETQFAWFAFNQVTKDSFEFGSFEEARDFCLHPDNARQPEIKVPRPGDRVRLISMRHDPDPLDPGQLGTVVSVRRHGAGADEWHQIDVAWDNGRSLMLVSPPDEFEIVGRR